MTNDLKLLKTFGFRLDNDALSGSIGPIAA